MKLNSTNLTGNTIRGPPLPRRYPTAAPSEHSDAGHPEFRRWPRTHLELLLAAPSPEPKAWGPAC
eukprot:224849-Amphidinium_carterae.1